MKSTTFILMITGLLAVAPVVSAGTTPDFRVHEWGTFTSVQGSDGEPVFWNPFVSSDLPEFVLTRKNPFPLTEHERTKFSRQRLGVKNSSHWLQRMETPVIYFHSDEDFSVDVEVGFPKGLITEWYPAVSSFGPVNGLPPAWEGIKRSHLGWKNLLVLGKSGDVTRVPVVDVPSHYFTARTAGASPVRVQHTLNSTQIGQEERFLFYRGAGNFSTPLHVGMDGTGNLQLENRGSEPLGRLFIYRNRDGHAVFEEIAGLAGGQNIKRSVGAGESGELLASRLVSALIDAGLFAEEAEAMVDTWRNDWLGDRGLRVLYLLSQKWTDETLPLKISPAPSKTVRVMVGRAEVIEPDAERVFDLALMDQLKGSKISNENDLRRLLEPRFLEPAISGAVSRRIATVVRPQLTKGERTTQMNVVIQGGGRLKHLLAVPPAESPVEVLDTSRAVTKASSVPQFRKLPDSELSALFDCRGSTLAEQSPNPATR